ncbi:MAG: hypothetical protein U0Q22_10950 [Acidimicrobiales bacterium]
MDGGRHALILGCGRSGTSIFGELFATFDNYTYLSEPHVPDIAAVAAAGPTAVKVPREAPGDPAVEDVLPDPVVFWQVRHPLDAICSLRVGIADDWGHHPRPADWLDWLDRPLLERCAHHWATINTVGYELVRDRAVVNHFEDMIRDPAATAERTAAIMGVDTAACRAGLDAWIDRVQDTNNERFVEAETSRRNSRPDHSRRIERWRENLTAADVASVAPLVAAGAATFRYRIPGYSAGAGNDGTSTPGV